MDKIVRIGTIPQGKSRASVFCQIQIKDGRLSISGVIGPTQSGNARGGCGQIDIEFAHRNPKDNDKRYSCPVQPEEFNFALGWNKNKWFTLLDIWQKWHLNGRSMNKEELPQDVTDFLEALPDTDKQPAWV